MKRLFLIAGIGAAFALTTPASAMTDAECTAAWTKADANKDGMVTEAEAGRYFAAMRVAEKPIADGRLSMMAFQEHCKAGHFNMTRMVVGAPLPGSNSFTENQAKDRILAAGMSGVSALLKDANGIWRGTAADGAKTVSVAVDYKGNVVSQ